LLDPNGMLSYAVRWLLVGRWPREVNIFQLTVGLHFVLRKSRRELKTTSRSLASL